LTTATERTAAALGLASLALLSGCLGSFKTPSAYHDQRYLCDAEHAAEMQALTDGCRVDASCAGAFSMRGTMQGEPLTVETQLSTAAFGVVQPPGDSTQTLDRVNLTGTSPYFQFIFHMKSVGGLVTTAGETTPRTLVLNGGASRLANSLADTQVDVGQFLEVGGASSDQGAVTNSGTVQITYLSSTELRGTFHGAFGQSADVVDGCFDVLPSDTTVNPMPIP
jgi:hypothetical protein